MDARNKNLLYREALVAVYQITECLGTALVMRLRTKPTISTFFVREREVSIWTKNSLCKFLLAAVCVAS